MLYTCLSLFTLYICSLTGTLGLVSNKVLVFQIHIIITITREFTLRNNTFRILFQIQNYRYFYLRSSLCFLTDIVFTRTLTISIQMCEWAFFSPKAQPNVWEAKPTILLLLFFSSFFLACNNRARLFSCSCFSRFAEFVRFSSVEFWEYFCETK